MSARVDVLVVEGEHKESARVGESESEGSGIRRDLSHVKRLLEIVYMCKRPVATNTTTRHCPSCPHRRFRP